MSQSGIEGDKLIDPENQKSLMDHIWDIKNVILYSGLVWLFFTLAAGVFHGKIQELLFEPANNVGLKLHFLSPIEVIMFSIKVSALAGLVLALPFITIIIWRYVQSALETKEKNAVFLFTLSSAVLTVTAVMYAWFGLIPNSLKLVDEWTPEGSEILLTIGEYFSFIFALTMALVLIFQIPTVIFTLIKSGLCTPKQVSSKRKEIYFAIIVATAIFGSPDLFSWLLTTAPAVFLFEVALIVSRLSIKNNKQ